MIFLKKILVVFGIYYIWNCHTQNQKLGPLRSVLCSQIGSGSPGFQAEVFNITHCPALLTGDIRNWIWDYLHGQQIPDRCSAIEPQCSTIQLPGYTVKVLNQEKEHLGGHPCSAIEALKVTLGLFISLHLTYFTGLYWGLNREEKGKEASCKESRIKMW